MFDLVLEAAISGALVTIFVFLSWVSVRRRLFQQSGWSFIMIGLGLLTFGTIIDITDNFPSLNAFVIIGDTPTQSVLEKAVGFFLGCAFLLVGFLKWIPVFGAVWDKEGALEVEMNLVDEVAEILTTTLDFDNVYPAFIEKLRELVTFDRLNINLLVEGTDQFKYTYVSGLNPPDLNVGDIRSLDGSVGLVVRTGQVLIEENISERDDRSRLQVSSGLGLRSALSAPLIVNGKVIGAICLRSKELSAYGDREKAIVERLVGQIAPAIAAAQAYEQLRLQNEALAESESQLDAIIESAADAIVIVDQAQKITVFNSGATDVFGFEKEEVLGQSLDLLIPERFQQLHRQHLQAFSSEAGGRRAMGEDRQAFGRRKDGSEFPLEASIQKIGAGSGMLLVAVLRDITERQTREAARLREAISQARQEELMESRRRVMTAAEEVRREIAQQLHGTVQNKLIVLQQRVGQLAIKSGDGASKDQLAELDQIFRDVIQNDLRGISHQLYPSVLRRGLVPALSSLVSRMQPSLLVRRQISEDVLREEALNPNLIPLATRLAAYRIVEDALTNVVKHSGSESATLRVELDQQERLRIMVRDEGKGFEVQESPASLGISLMRDYAHVAGGEFEISSSPGAGTEVTALLPLAEDPSMQPH